MVSTGNVGQLVVLISMDPSQYLAGARSLRTSAQQIGDSLSQASNVGAAGLDKVSSHASGARRELLVMAHELATGNLSNFFGSIGVFAERIDAIALVANPLGAAIAVATGAVAAFAVAAYKGHEETEAFNNSLILTGNYAGLTSSGFAAMAQQISKASGDGIGTGRDALQALTSTGQFTGQALLLLGDDAVRMHDLTGKSLEDIAKDYAQMPAGVAKWAEQHNSSMHFITTAEYDYIRQLEDAGDKQAAVLRVAQDLDAHLSGESLPNLGALEKAWRGVGSALSSVWDWVKGIGREETSAEKIAAATAEVQRLQNALNAPSGAMNRDLLEPQLKAARDQLDALNRDALREQDNATNQSMQAGIQQAGVAASDFLKKLQDEEKGIHRVDEALKQYRQNVAAYNAANPNSPVSPSQQASDEAYIRKQYADKSGDAAANRLRKNTLDAALQTTRNGLDLINAAYKSADDQLQALHKAQLISDQTFYEAEITAANDSAAKQIAAYQQEKATLQDAYWRAPADERIRITQEIGEVDTKIAKVQQDNHTKVAVLLTQEAQAQRDYLKTIQDAHNALLAQAGDSVPKALSDYDQRYRGASLQAVSTGDLSGAAFLDANRSLTQINAQYNDIVEQAKEAQASIALDQQSGLTGLFDGFSQLRDNSESTVQSLQALYDQVNKLSWSTTDEGVLRSLDQLRDKIRQSMLDSQGYLQDFTEAGRNAFGEMFSDIATGTRTPAQAVASMITSMIGSFARLFAEREYGALTNAILGSINPVSTVSGSNTWGFAMPSSIQGSGALFGVGAGLGFATGGSVWGPGTGTSDSVNAHLSNGEFVVKESVASRPGMRSFLTALNGGGAISGANRFAGGGAVAMSSDGSTMQPNVNVTIQNAPAGTQVQRSTGPGGVPNIKFILPLIDQHIAGGILTGKSSTAKAMQTQYGLNRATGIG